MMGLSANNICGLITGIVLSSLFHETLIMNEILHTGAYATSLLGSDDVNIELSNNPQQPNLQERLEKCSRKLEEIMASKHNQTMLPKEESAAICVFHKGFNGLYYVDEFVDYHLALGFNQIYIYDNSPSFDLKAWAISRNPSTVIVKHVPGETINESNAYKLCLEEQTKGMEQPTAKEKLRNKIKGPKYKNEWLAFLDTDEFIVLKNNHTHSNNTIMKMLKNTVPKDKAGLALSRRSFIFNETQLHGEPIPVTKRFQYHVKEVDPFVKAIAKTNQILKADYHHVAYRGNKQVSIDSNGHPISTTGLVKDNSVTNVAVIHHYETKSLAEFQSKCHHAHHVYANSVKYGAEARAKEHSCPSQDEIKQAYQELIVGSNKEEEGGGNELVFDDTAWQLLYKSVPVYAKYNSP